jgi:TetR/AcrR family transcriptional repressor of nem operon
MKAAGLTSGALHGQFKNKEDLCSQAICSALDDMLESYRGTVSELGSDMAKGTARAKRAYQGRIEALVQIFADGLGPGPEAARRAKAQNILGSMLGAMTFARAVNDGEIGDEFLSQMRSQLLRELDQGGRPSKE